MHNGWKTQGGQEALCRGKTELERGGIITGTRLSGHVAKIASVLPMPGRAPAKTPPLRPAAFSFHLSSGALARLF